MVEVDDGDGIIILTDTLGGTPTNLSLPFLKDDGVQIVTGVNVPMLLALSSYRSGRSPAFAGGHGLSTVEECGCPPKPWRRRTGASAGCAALQVPRAPARGAPLEEVCDLVRNSGRRSIVLVKHTLRLKKRTGRPNPHDYPGRRRVPCI